MKTPTLNQIYAQHSTPEARVDAIIKDWDMLLAEATAGDRAGLPMAANTYSGTLVTSFLMDGSLTPLQAEFAPLANFSIDFTPDPVKPMAGHVLKNPTSASATQTDATNFESGNTVVGALSVTTHQYTQAFQVSNSDLNSGLRMKDLAIINATAFATKINQVATSIITTANFTGTPLTVSPGSFGFSDAATLQGQLKKSSIKNLVLDGEYLAQLSNTPSFVQKTGTGNSWSGFGWDNISLLTDWTGAGANVRGFACNPQAIVGVTGVPVSPAAAVLSQSNFTVPGLNITVAFYSWFNPATRTMWYSYDMIAGFTLGDATAGIVVKSS